ncbi:WbqC family protein [Bacteroidota bacterium]
MKKAAIIQSNYLPWKGYFDIINDVDEFVIYDSVQYTKFDWRNRNLIKTDHGTKWLTIPVGKSTNRLINEVKLPGIDWEKSHLSTIYHYYNKTPYHKEIKAYLKNLFYNNNCTFLSEFNQFLIERIAVDYLNIQTQFNNSSKLNVTTHEKTEKIIEILKQIDASVYVSGPAAKHYLDEKKLMSAGIKLIYKNYSEYPEYPQLYPPFEHGVSIIDMLFNLGKDTKYYIWGKNNGV